MYKLPKPPENIEELLELVHMHAVSNRELDEYVWSFDPSFSPGHFDIANDHEHLWEIFDNENQFLEGCLENPRQNEQFYDSYWGWWSSPETKTGKKCPILVLNDQGQWSTWDGWHRIVIAQLARIKAVPALIGIHINYAGEYAKEANDSYQVLA